MSRLLVLSLFAFLLGSIDARGMETKKMAIDAARELTGEYRGAWKMFGLDPEGKVIEVASWTDVVKAESPVVQGDRVFVSVTSTMTLSNGQQITHHFKEGFFVEADGTAGTRYIEANGVTTLEHPICPSVWVMETTLSQDELQMMGFGPGSVISQSNVTIKTTMRKGKSETEYVTRVSTLRWKEAGGPRETQFTSLLGSHQTTRP